MKEDPAEDAEELDGKVKDDLAERGDADSGEEHRNENVIDDILAGAGEDDLYEDEDEEDEGGRKPSPERAAQGQDTSFETENKNEAGTPKDSAPKEDLQEEDGDGTQDVKREIVQSDAVRQEGFPLGLRYFIIKSYNHRNIATSIDKGKWATNSKANENKLDAAYKHSSGVVLVFSVNGSGCFQGFAKMTSALSNETDQWTGQSSSNTNFGRSFGIEWFQLADLPFKDTQNLHNPLNDNLPVRIARDCQELPPDLGFELCRMIDAVGVSQGKPSRLENLRSFALSEPPEGFNGNYPQEFSHHQPRGTRLLPPRQGQERDVRDYRDGSRNPVMRQEPPPLPPMTPYQSEAALIQEEIRKIEATDIAEISYDNYVELFRRRKQLESHLSQINIHSQAPHMWGGRGMGMLPMPHPPPLPAGAPPYAYHQIRPHYQYPQWRGRRGGHRGHYDNRRR